MIRQCVLRGIGFSSERGKIVVERIPSTIRPRYSFETDAARDAFDTLVGRLERLSTTHNYGYLPPATNVEEVFFQGPYGSRWRFGRDGTLERVVETHFMSGYRVTTIPVTILPCIALYGAVGGDNGFSAR